MKFFIPVLVTVVLVALCVVVKLSLPNEKLSNPNSNGATKNEDYFVRNPPLNKNRNAYRPTIYQNDFRNIKYRNEDNRYTFNRPTMNKNRFTDYRPPMNGNNVINNNPPNYGNNVNNNQQQPMNGNSNIINNQQQPPVNGNNNINNNINQPPTNLNNNQQQPTPPMNGNNVNDQPNLNNQQPQLSSPNESNTKTVLIITLLHSSNYIESFFSLINGFTYPKSRISIGILEGDSEDFSTTMEKLNRNININTPLYRRITLVHKNANLKLADRRERHMQLYRRKKLAELRNYVLKETLKDEEYVLWIDSDVVSSPHRDIIELMMSVDKDVVVPNCLLDDANDARYDANTWILTPTVIEYINRQKEDFFLMNPYIQFPEEWIQTIYQYRDKTKPLLYQIDVDAVGGTMILAKSKVFKSGVVFPEELYDHCIETEGFGRMAKKNGFQLVGLPNLIIYHAHNR